MLPPLLSFQRFEAGDDVEKLFVDPALAQTMKLAVEAFRQFVDVFVGAPHRRQSARVFARERFSAGPEQRNKEVLPE